MALPPRDVTKVEFPPLELKPNPGPPASYMVNVEHPEWSNVCPKTGYPDFGRLVVSYIPGKYIMELKSFKMYCLEYYGTGIYHEHVANKILDDIFPQLEPSWMGVAFFPAPRGGIVTTVFAQRGDSSLPQVQAFAAVRGA